MPYGSTLAAYTKSKMSHKGAFAPKGNEVYRFEFDFNSNEEAEEAFNNLIEGKSLLSEYKQYISRPEYTDCI